MLGSDLRFQTSGSSELNGASFGLVAEVVVRIGSCGISDVFVSVWLIEARGDGLVECHVSLVEGFFVWGWRELVLRN